MPGSLEMMEGVATRRLLAAADVSTAEAEAEVDPRVAGRQALLAAVGPRIDVPGLIEMGAGGPTRCEQTYHAPERVADLAHAGFQTGAHSATQSSTATVTGAAAAVGRARGSRT